MNGLRSSLAESPNSSLSMGMISRSLKLEPPKPAVRRPCRTKLVRQLSQRRRGYLMVRLSSATMSHGRRNCSKKGFTRKAAPIDLEDDENNYGLKEFVTTTLTRMGVDPSSYDIEGTYLNYYEDGSMWTPDHTHPGLHQLVISLGASRTFVSGEENIHRQQWRCHHIRISRSWCTKGTKR